MEGGRSRLNSHDYLKERILSRKLIPRNQLAICSNTGGVYTEAETPVEPTTARGNCPVHKMKMNCMMILITYILTAVVSGETFLPTFPLISEEATYTVTEKDVRICRSLPCPFPLWFCLERPTEFCRSIRFCSMLSAASGSFSSTSQICSANDIDPDSCMSYAKNRTVVNVRDDGDRCCPTARVLTRPQVLTLSGSSHECHVAQIPADRLFQHVMTGECRDDGACSGTCVQETRIVSLLAYCPTQTPPLSSARGVMARVYPFQFKLFRVPAYCSCKNVAPSR